jgi:hypothetical protein
MPVILQKGFHFFHRESLENQELIDYRRSDLVKHDRVLRMWFAKRCIMHLATSCFACKMHLATPRFTCVTRLPTWQSVSYDWLAISSIGEILYIMNCGRLVLGQTCRDHETIEYEYRKLPIRLTASNYFQVQLVVTSLVLFLTLYALYVLSASS